MLANRFFQNGPNSRAVLLQLLLGHLDCVNFLIVNQLVENKRFEQLSRHHLGQATLVQLQGRPYDNYGSARVVNTLTKQVLAETALLALEHVTQGFQWTLVGTNHRTPSTTIVKERVDRFLKHPLLIFDDNARCTQFDQTLQAIISMNHSTIQIVEVACRKTPTFQWHQRS